ELFSSSHRFLYVKRLDDVASVTELATSKRLRPIWVIFSLSKLTLMTGNFNGCSIWTSRRNETLLSSFRSLYAYVSISPMFFPATRTSIGVDAPWLIIFSV